MQIKDLAVGSYVRDPNTQWCGSPIVWEVVNQGFIDTDGGTDNTLLFAKEILMLAPFDNPEPTSTIAKYKTNGANIWSSSNLRQWLNAEGSNWYSKPSSNEYDEPPSGGSGRFRYDNIPGFLSNFSTEFKEKIVRCKTTTQEYNFKSSALKYFASKCHVWIPSAYELGIGADTKESNGGANIPYLNGQANMNHRKRPLSQAAKDLYKAQGLSNAYETLDNRMWTRSNDTSYTHMRIATASLSIGSAQTHTNAGVCPMINVKNDIEVELSSDGVYELKLSDTPEPPAPSRVDFSNINLSLKDKISSRELNGNEFELEVQPTWESITNPQGLLESYELFKVVNSSDTKLNFTKENKLNTISEYRLEVTLTDPNYSDNTKKFTASFKVIPQKVVFPTDINFKESHTNSNLSNGRFQTQAKPIWDRVTGTKETVTLLKGDSTSTTPAGFSFNYGTNIATLGKYTVKVVMVDVNDSNNTKTYTSTFEVIAEEATFPSDLDLKLRDKLTGQLLSGTFKFKVQPTWNDYTSKFTEVAKLTKPDGSIVNFTKETTLTDGGNYTLSLTLTDKNYSNRTKTYTSKFTIDVPTRIDFETYNVDFKDKLSKGNLSGIFYDDVVPTWTISPSSPTVNTSYRLTKDGTVQSNFYFEKTLSKNDTGHYILILTLTDPNFADNSKEYQTEFDIKPADINLSQYTVTAKDYYTSNALTVKFTEKVKPTWTISPTVDKSKVDVSYKLYKGSNKQLVPNFVELQELTDLDTYSLVITLTDKNNSNNTKDFEFNFEIVARKLDTSKITVSFKDKLPPSRVLNGNFEAQVQPTWTVNNADGFEESYWLEDARTGNQIPFVKEQVLNTIGRYRLTLRLTDSNRPDNYKDFSATFNIIPEQIDFSAVDVNLTDEFTNRQLSHSMTTFELKVKPVWTDMTSVLDVEESYTLTNLDTNTTISYNKGDIISDLGQYEICVRLSNKQDSSNYKDFYGDFQIIPKQINFNPLNFIDKLTNSPLTGDFTLKAQPTWDELVEGATETATISLNNGTPQSFTKETLLTTLGHYTLTVERSNIQDSTNKIVDTTEFNIIPEEANLDIDFFDDFTSSIIVNNSTFQEKVRIRWELPNNTNITVNVEWTDENGVNGRYLNINSNDKILTTPGSYSLTYIINDNYHPLNQATGQINFIITAKTEDLNDYDVIFQELLSNSNMVEGSEYEEQCKPFVSLSPASDKVNMTVRLKYENSYIPFSNNRNDLLTNVGDYCFEVTLVDVKNPSSFRVIELNFRIVPTETDLNDFELTFINALTNKIVSENQQFVLPTNVVRIHWGDLPKDVTVVDYRLLKDGNVEVYDVENTVLQYVGQYSFEVTVKNYNNDNKTYIRNFELVNSNLDLMQLEINITDILTNYSEITQNREFVETQVQPTWNIPDRTEITYSLDYEGNKVQGYVRGTTILSDYGKYVLHLTVSEIGNSSNQRIIDRTFFIIKKKVNLNPEYLHLLDDLTAQDIADGQVFPVQVLPDYSYNDPDGSVVNVTGTLYRNGNLIKSFEPGKDIYNLPGDYTYTIIVSDPNYPENEISKTVNFTILAQPIDLSDREIIITNILENYKIINFGEIFKALNPSVQPTWVQYSDLDYTYNLKLNDVPYSGYNKEDVLRQLGKYELYVRGTDPNYPTNYIETTIIFYLEREEEEVEPEVQEEAYLNGLPYVMGTPITDPGQYDLIVVRKNPNNFKYTLTEVQFTVVDDDLVEKPIIVASPSTELTDKVTVKIFYPSYSKEKEYKINANGVWKGYTDEFEVTDNCTIYARCKDGLSDYLGEATKIIDNIDKRPPNPPELIGFEDGRDTYFTVTPNVKPEYGCTYSAILNGISYDLGTPIYNENQELKEYTLVVTATKKNGLTASTTRRFILDSIPPDPPTIIGISPNVVQSSARPDVIRVTNNITRTSYSVKSLYKTTKTVLVEDKTCDYEGFLNGTTFELGTLVEVNGSYKFSATAIKRSNGLRATSVEVFTILNPVPESIGLQRLAIIPLKETYKARAIDGEFLVDYTEGHLSIFDDGTLLSKTRELENIINVLDKKLNLIEINITNNESKLLALSSSKDTMKKLMDDLIIKLIEAETDVILMEKNINNYDFTDMSELEALKAEANQIAEETSRIGIDIDITRSNIFGRPDVLKTHIKGLIHNASGIAECIWWKENKNYI